MSLGLRLSRRLRTIAGSALCMVAACGDGPVDPAPELEISLEGWLERGGEADVTLTSDGIVVAPGAIEWSFDPVAAAVLTAEGRLRFVSVGPITVRGRVGEQVDSVVVEIGLPPTILFDRSVEGNRDLWTVLLDGANLTRLTTSPAADLEGAAADGEVVFVSYRDGNAELYALSAPGGEPQRLTNNARADLTPAVAPDGEQVAYTNDTDGTPQLWLLDLTTGSTAAAHEVPEPGIVHTSPAWRPGSDAVAYVTTTAGTADIHLFSPGSGVSAPLVEGPHADVEPAWDAAGERLAFVSNRDGDTELYLLDVAFGEITRLTHRPGSDAHPTWLEDGRIVYVESGSGASRLMWLDPAKPERLYEIPIDGGGAARPAAFR